MFNSMHRYRVQAFWRSGSGQSPYMFAMLSGGCIGIASSLAGLLCLLILETLLPKALWGPSAAAFLADSSAIVLFFQAVLLTPFIETFIAQLLPLEITRGLGLGPAACIAIVSALWGLGHYLNGGLAHGISAALGGAFFSTAYMLMRAHGYLPACLSSYSAHMTHNFLLLFVFG